jgi:hypothetical protein
MPVLWDIFMAKTLTTNYSLAKYAIGDTGWGSDVSANFDTIDSTMYTFLTIISAAATYQPIGSYITSGGALGTPSSGTLTNCTFPTLNQNTTGSAGSLKSPATTGLATLTGMGAGQTRAYTVPDADATILYSGGALGTPASGTVTNLTGTASININGTVGATTPTTIVGTTITASASFKAADNIKYYLGTANDVEFYYNGTNCCLVTDAVGSGKLVNRGGVQIYKPADVTSVTLANSMLHLGLGDDEVGSLMIMTFGYSYNRTNVPAYMGFVETSRATYTKGDLIFGTRDVVTETAPDERLRITSAGTVKIVADNQSLTFGTGTDASLYYDGTNFVCNPKLVGSGALSMLGDIQLTENTAIQLDPAGSADEKWSGITCTGTAGATVAVGDLLYLDVTAGEWLLADADAASTSGDVPLALCILAANNGEATNLLLIGTMRSAAFPASIALGAPVYVSTSAGDIQAAQPSGPDDVIRRVGWAITTEPNTIYFNPSNDYITVEE